MDEFDALITEPETPNAKFMYVISAVESAAGMLTTYKHYPDMAYRMFEDVKDQEPHIDVGILSNAFSEKRDLKEFWQMMKVDNQSDVVLQGDSGGLQVITLGKEITPELKKEIYQRQCHSSMEAMCFDEIPLKVLSAGGGILGTVVEYVDSLFKINAIKTGQNIAEQIRIFQKEKPHNAKIMFILQGKDFATLREWAWFAFEEIKKVDGYEDYIKGLAVGVVENLGIRGMADFMLRFQEELEFLPQEWTKKVHVLGAGTISKSITYFLVGDDYYLPGTVISADSTTQTRAMVFGKYVFFDPVKEKLVSVDAGRGITEQSKFVIQKIYDFVKPYMDTHQVDYDLQAVCVDSYREHYSEYNEDLKRKKKEFDTDYEYKKVARISRYFWSLSMVSDFVKYLESVKRRTLRYQVAGEDERNEILASLKVSLPQTVFKATRVALGMKSYNDYMLGSEGVIIKGHPYTIKMSTVADNIQPDTDGMVTINDQPWITDLYKGELLGRKLLSTSANSETISPQAKRGQFLSHLNGNPIATVITEDDQIDTLDEW